MTTISVEAAEVHPEEFVSVYVNVPTGSPVRVVLVPDPEFVVLSDDRESVHEPVEGRPLRATLPVGTEHVGCVIVPIMGVVGVEGCALIIITEDEADVSPEASVTVYV